MMLWINVNDIDSYDCNPCNFCRFAIDDVRARDDEYHGQH